MKHFKLLFIIFAIISSIGLAQEITPTSSTSSIFVNVKGMVCDFCARGLEKGFGKRNEVENINIDMSNNLITINLKADATLDDETITELVKSNGISVEHINRQL